MNHLPEKPKRGAPNDSNRILAYVLIGVGALFLLNNLGIFSGILNLWPLILVGLGVYMIVNRDKSTMTVKRETFTAPLDAAERARVKIALPIGGATITHGEKPELLLDADMVYVGEMRFSTEGDAEKIVTMGQAPGSWLNWINPSNWDWSGREQMTSRLRLTPRIPLSLTLSAGVGESRIDLSRLHLTNLEIDGGVGEVDIALPAQGESYDARMSVGVGEMTITIPSGAAVRARIKGGIGETEVRLPLDAAVRVEASAGIGEINIPSRLRRVSGSGGGGFGKSGVWESEGFASAERQIVIDFDGGVGEFTVK